ncbi:MAG TPA: hypothetical protein VG126_04780 [Thermoleophilaceae bacterium]|nr:hypothetical protein [Thermoleophilaceae bacterium]
MSELLAHGEGTRPPWLDRLEAAGLALAIVVGSALLWIGVPVGSFWVAARITPDGVTAVLLALLAIPPTMAAFGWLLYRASARYEDLRGVPERPRSPPAWRTSLGEERASERRRTSPRSLIDVAMTVSATAALIALTIWFFFFAEMHLSPLP